MSSITVVVVPLEAKFGHLKTSLLMDVNIIVHVDGG